MTSHENKELSKIVWSTVSNAADKAKSSKMTDLALLIKN